MGKFAFDPPEVDKFGRHHFNFHSDTVEGSVKVHPHRNQRTLGVKSLKVVYAGARPKQSNSGEDVPNVAGPRVMREVLSHIKKAFPTAKNIYGNRTSGARYAGMSDEEYDAAGGQVGTRVGAKLK